MLWPLVGYMDNRGMADYDFKILQPSEFECLSRDLIQARDGVFIESFTAGKDGGIDFRYALSKDKAAIIQVKRYETLASLLSILKKEVEKVKKLKPQRYYVVTSVGLTPNNKDAIKDIFAGVPLSTEDILGRDDLNNLLGIYPDIEKKYYKLWLSSTNVLESILHKRIENWAAFEMDRIKSDIHQYVINKSFDEALNILSEHKYVIISGIPGIGKTTLARMLVYQLLANGMEEFIFIPSDIDDAVEMFREDKKQIFLFDDFLGSTVLEMGERKFDQKILSFIEKVQHSTGKLFILTTREYILSDAMLHYEKFALKHIDIAKCTLSLHYYTKQIKAAILYNHLADAHLPDKYIEALLEDGNYKKLINHTNFNPRVIETFINDKVWETVTPKGFMSKLMSFFYSPMSVWEKAFEKLEITTRYILLVLTTMPLPVRVSDWRTAFEHFRQHHLAKLGLYCDEQKWIEAIRVLEDCFIRTDKIDDQIIVRLYNPSVKDFLSTYITNHKEICELLIRGTYYVEQLYTTFSDWKWFNQSLFSGSSYVILDTLSSTLVKDVFLRLHEGKKTCKLLYTNKQESKVIEYDEFAFLQNVLKYFPQMCRNNPGLIEHFVDDDLLKDDGYEVSERLKFLNDINLEYTEELQAEAVLKDIYEDLEFSEDYVDFIETAVDLDTTELLKSDDFRERFVKDISHEIDLSGSDTDLDTIEENIEKVSLKFPEWELDFEDDLEFQRAKISEKEYENDDWKRDYKEDSSVDEDTLINEMFTSLRIKEYD